MPDKKLLMKTLRTLNFIFFFEDLYLLLLNCYLNYY